jgi:hypothetical protein
MPQAWFQMRRSTDRPSDDVPHLKIETRSTALKAVYGAPVHPSERCMGPRQDLFCLCQIGEHIIGAGSITVRMADLA